VGNTPLLQLRHLSKDLPAGVEIWMKAEHLNPSGSVKDRAARAMFLAGIESGQLTPDKILLDATSGNTGIAYAMMGAALGYSVALCMPKNASLERKRILCAYGAEIIETDPLQSSDGAQRKAIELAAQYPKRYFYPDQYNNPANWQAHYHGTALEIWQQTQGRVSHFVAGMGTSGTFMGTSRRLKELNFSVKALAMQPDSPLHGLEGMKHMATTLKPGIYDPSLADGFIEVDTDEARDTALALARHEGLFVGISSGGNVAAALKLARTLREPAQIVTILCDNGSRYLGEDLWDGGRYARD
jgi:S-sulfo-L-cysteine synthase (O-acetyl-L-serine-dependent)